jgi:hypothetical protein
MVMEIMLASAAFVVSAFCAGLMGFAIQRGDVYGGCRRRD